MRSRVLFACLVAVLVAACGGDAGDTTTTAGADAATTTEALPDTTEESTDTEPDDSGDGASTVCLEATQAMAAAMSSYGQGFSGAMTGGLDAESLEQAAKQLQAMAGAAPAEIQDDFDVIAEELGAFYEALAESGYEPGAVPTPEQIEQLEALADAMDEERFQEASDNIEAWFDENC